MQGETLRLIYQSAKSFLENLVGKEILDEKLGHIRTYKVDNMSDMYNHLLWSLTNKRNMQMTIGDIDLLEPFFFDFDPVETHQQYNYRWQELFQRIKEAHKPPGPMDMSNEQGYWAVFSKGALSGAAFLASFRIFEAIDAYFMGFQHHDLAIPALPMILEREIYGMGFPLACDFLKEAGYTNYGKPDVHVKDILCSLELVDCRDNYEVFKTLLRIARANNELSAVIDKLLYLIGSGNIGKPEIKIGRQKKVFIEQMKTKLAGFDTDLSNGSRGDGEGADRKNPEGGTG
jgi:hypothetical protein